MYIGLFLLIPFLNIIFNNIDKKQFKTLIIVLMILTILPSILNIYNFDSLSWWLKPSTGNKYYKLVPNWWSAMYPITYYYIGAYLSKYKPKISISKNIFLIVISTLLYALFNYYRSYGTKYVTGLWIDYSSIFVLIISVLFFNLLLNIKINNTSKKDYFFKLISDSVLGAYLISCMFDLIVYKKLAKLVVNAKDRIFYVPITVIVVFILSLSLSILVELIYRFFNKKLTRSC